MSERVSAACARLVVLAAGVVFMISVPSVVQPLLLEYWNVASGEERASFDLTVTSDGAEIELKGKIALGAGIELQRLVRMVPTITQLRLDSAGGRVAEVPRLQRVIEEHRLTTIVSGRCLSVCVLVFVAGEERLVTEDARIGVHGFSAPTKFNVGFDEQYERERAYLRKRGVHEEFIEKIFNVPNTRVWWLSSEELTRFGLTTRLPKRG